MTKLALGLLSLGLAVGCSADGSGKGGDDGSGTGTGGDASGDGGDDGGDDGDTGSGGGGGDDGGDDGAGACEGVNCGNGVCTDVTGEGRCVCDEGYVEDRGGPTCVPENNGGDGGGDDGGDGGTGDGGDDGLPDGTPCEEPSQCASGYCWADWNFQQMEPGETVCQSDCIPPAEDSAYCAADADCCNNSCNTMGMYSGYCSP